MPSFSSQKEIDKFVRLGRKVTSNDRALLIDPVRHTIEGEYDERGKPRLVPEHISEVPADQVQHYLDKGFRWPKS